MATLVSAEAIARDKEKRRLGLYPSSAKRAQYVATYRARGGERIRAGERASSRQWVKDHPERVAAQRKHNSGKHRDVRRKLLAILKSVPCQDCSTWYPPHVMDFDHIDPSRKTMNIGQAMLRGMPFQKVLDEIGLCDVVCSNCHRERTYQRRKGVSYART